MKIVGEIRGGLSILLCEPITDYTRTSYCIFHKYNYFAEGKICQWPSDMSKVVAESSGFPFRADLVRGTEL